jgi:TolB protein
MGQAMMQRQRRAAFASTALLRLAVLAAVVGGLTFAALDARPSSATSPGRIVFVSTRDDNFEIYSMTPDGYGPTRLTNNPAEDTTPAVSPDGSKIAFASTRDSNYEIYVMDADGSNQTNVSNSPASNELAPSWSPDGSKILFTTDRDGDIELYTMDPNGDNQTNLTNVPASNEAYAAWSPDGAHIAFLTDRDAGDFELYVMDADGSNATNISNDPGAFDAFPAWSPDSAQIAFITDRDGNREIYKMNADGSGQTRLTNNTSDDNAATWSPDGTRIAYTGLHFTAPFTSNDEVFVMNADGTNVRNLTNSPHADGFPSWSAVPLPSGDTDGDGCTDTQEAGVNPAQGGRRNAKVFWDFGDMPLETMPGSGIFVRNRLIRVGDILAVVKRYFTNDAGGTAAINRLTDPLSTPPATGYHPAFDRGGQSGANAWNVAPPDGIITVADILFVVKQYYHDCA